MLGNLSRVLHDEHECDFHANGKSTGATWVDTLDNDQRKHNSAEVVSPDVHLQLSVVPPSAAAFGVLG